MLAIPAAVFGLQAITAYIVADESGAATFETNEDAENYLVLGFDEAPVVLDVTDPEQPSVVSGAAIEKEDDVAVLVTSEAGRVIHAADESAIKQVNTIELLE